MVFKVDGGGDPSVGISDTHATVTVEDNFKEVDEDQLELFREFLREFYDIPKHMGAVLTLEEYEKQEELETKFQKEQEKEYWESLKEEDKKEHVFIEKAIELGYEVEPYSGRGMFGRECPSVTVSNPEDFIAKIGMKGLKIDNMGKQYVVYTG